MVVNIIFYDFECFRHDWMMVYLDTETRSYGNIVNSKIEFESFYSKHKNKIWCGYNSRQYDQWIAKAILCDFNPYEMNDWIINKDRKGFEFSRMLSNFPILNYDCIYGFKSLKELEGYLGLSIKETSVSFNIDRKLTVDEIQTTLEYCKHDVECTFHVFVENKSEFESHMGLIKEFGLPLSNVSKTKAQISASILGAVKRDRNDEFDIRLPDTLQLGKYSWIADWYMEWAKNDKNYETMSLKTEVAEVTHVFGIGGLHGARNGYLGDGYYLMADVSSYYPALMIEYNYLSRNVYDPKKYKQIRDDRLEMKRNKDPREYPRKIVLNGTFGAQKDQYNQLYDPQQANNICIAGQLLLLDLIEKLEGHCELIQSNTDGILIKLLTPEHKAGIIAICDEWSQRTRMVLEFEEINKVIQRDVNNYIIVKKNGKIKRKGAVVKQLSLLDNDLPIVNRAVVDYFVHGVPVETTIHSSKKLIDFQKITKIGSSYEHVVHNGVILHERVNRCFASIDHNDTTLYKKSAKKTNLDKIANTPEHCFIDNGDITEKEIPFKLDLNWYITLTKHRIQEFI